MIDFHDAVQDPRNTFTDPELKACKVAVTQSGLPLALGGTFALTYTVQSGQKKLAVRCFHREVPQAQNRYAKISTKLRSLASPYFVNFEFQPQGIRVLRTQYPIVKMDWADGDTLGIYLDRVASNSGAIAALRQAFATMGDYLERNAVSHGDIQNENVIVANRALRLIDYDGMFVSGLPEGQGTEVGHKHFQHPERSTKHFGPKMDRFSFLVVDTSLEALQANPSLYPRFREGGQAIIFKANDFANPASSEIFRILNAMPAVCESAKKLAAVCGASIANVPTLPDFKAGRNIAIPVVSPVGVSPRAAPTRTYIGAFKVLDGKQFYEVLRCVGDRIELVGQIVSVRRAVGRAGRRSGLPFVFINFGTRSYESVKITIWSEVLGKMDTPPTDAWVGRWISVTGLIEFYERKYGRPFRNLGITLGSTNQIIQISEQDAKFRLGRGGGQRPQNAKGDTSKRTNADILDQILGGTGSHPCASGSGKTVVPTLSHSPVGGASLTNRNHQILRGIQGGPSQAQGSNLRHSPPPQAQGSYPSYTPPPTKQALLARIPIWVWIGAAILLAIILMNTMTGTRPSAVSRQPSPAETRPVETTPSPRPVETRPSPVDICVNGKPKHWSQSEESCHPR